MEGSKLRNKSGSDEDMKSYTKHQNICVLLLRKMKNNYYSSLNERNITDTIWKAVKPMLPNRYVSSEKNNLSWKSENSYDWERDGKDFKRFILKYY